jgi:predicted  nucleic acid-binding Zn-ribbon protein
VDSDDASLARLDREVTDEHRQIARLEQELKQVQWDVKKDSQYLRADHRAARRERADSAAHSRA